MMSKSEMLVGIQRRVMVTSRGQVEVGTMTDIAHETETVATETETETETGIDMVTRAGTVMTSAEVAINVECAGHSCNIQPDS
jgi:hypothetical protein